MFKQSQVIGSPATCCSLGTSPTPPTPTPTPPTPTPTPPTPTPTPPPYICVSRDIDDPNPEEPPQCIITPPTQIPSGTLKIDAGSCDTCSGFISQNAWWPWVVTKKCYLMSKPSIHGDGKTYGLADCIMQLQSGASSEQ